MKEVQKNWYEKNLPLGRSLGYPECCIKEFGMQPPALMRKRSPTRQDKRRYNAACIDGAFTGFIPCDKHARQIIAGEIAINDLISNRDNQWGKFPNENRR